VPKRKCVLLFPGTLSVCQQGGVILQVPLEPYRPPMESRDWAERGHGGQILTSCCVQCLWPDGRGRYVPVGFSWNVVCVVLSAGDSGQALSHV
jgi:hypothetical protein